MSNKQRNGKHNKPDKSFEGLAGNIFDGLGGGTDNEKSVFTGLLSCMIKPTTRNRQQTRVATKHDSE